MTGSTSSTSLDSSFFALGDPTEQRVIYGPGSSTKVGEFAKHFGSRALVVTDLGVSFRFRTSLPPPIFTKVNC
jgi:hypothetical protein